MRCSGRAGVSALCTVRARGSCVELAAPDCQVEDKAHVLLELPNGALFEAASSCVTVPGLRGHASTDGRS